MPKSAAKAQTAASWLESRRGGYGEVDVHIWQVDALFGAQPPRVHHLALERLAGNLEHLAGSARATRLRAWAKG
eukprot:5667272-Prymnesium_polylepis.1